MTVWSSRLWAAALTFVFVAGCDEGISTTLKPVPSQLSALSTPPATAPVGSVIGALSVKAVDKDGAPVAGTVVTFTVTIGSGSLSPRVDTTKSDGTAATTFVLGSIPGRADVAATTVGAAPVKFTVTGVVGATEAIVFTPGAVRISMTTDSVVVTASPRDHFGNATGSTVSWVSRDPSMLSVTDRGNNSAMVTAVTRPGQTYVVGTSNGISDSVLVSLPDAFTSACEYVTPPVTLALGQAVAASNGRACIHSDGSPAEYVLAAHFNSTITDASALIELRATGVATNTDPFPIPGSTPAALVREERDLSFEAALRHRESEMIRPRVRGAREWYSARAQQALIPQQVNVGDVVPVNVNALNFCDSPKIHSARVVALTSGAVILADTQNPVGGFSDAEYREFAVAIDTLVNPVDTAAFGSPSDIDGNHRVVVLFTRAVNELTQPGSGSGIILGFFYIRDLLPKTSAFGDCPASNFSEMFYIIVPDPSATINGNARSKSFVQSTATATISHEYQHLINASRRMYVTNAPRVDEEVWLNEGLSHIAEELVFYRASGLSPRQNLDAATLAPGTTSRAMFDLYQRSNFGRYREYLRFPETNAPFAANDLLPTRGAAWSFLRFVADRARTTDGDFWRGLIDSQLTGVPNLDRALAASGMTTLSAVKDWSMSVMADDNPPSAPAAFQQPSWNMLSALPASGQTFAFFTRPLADGQSTQLPLVTGGTSYFRFKVPAGKDALLQLSGPNTAPLPNGVRVTVLRFR